MTEKSPEYWIDKLRLKRHPEGGFYNEIYRSGEEIPAAALPERYNSGRTFYTSIYFLLKENEYSAFHRLQSDEIWHFYTGGPCNIHIISPEGILKQETLGDDIDSDQNFQVIVPHGCWFAANPCSGSSYSLVGCTMAPGFSFEDFDLARYEELSRTFPKYSEIIRRYSRK